eukprot:TRINITY_DN1356_c0_g1_i3.p6 TRINITY_DN1356_c0_g1~~TRINITY_DN1356_c0_g1_i3.p6  ORF type:complete len:100 (-),score=3.94 TRINITY_DN1356_c0_g1_i3:515-814(-)
MWFGLFKYMSKCIDKREILQQLIVLDIIAIILYEIGCMFQLFCVICWVVGQSSDFVVLAIFRLVAAAGVLIVEGSCAYDQGSNFSINQYFLSYTTISEY